MSGARKLENLVESGRGIGKRLFGVRGGFRQAGLQQEGVDPGTGMEVVKAEIGRNELAILVALAAADRKFHGADWTEGRKVAPFPGGKEVVFGRIFVPVVGQEEFEGVGGRLAVFPHDGEFEEVSLVESRGPERISVEGRVGGIGVVGQVNALEGLQDTVRSLGNRRGTGEGVADGKGGGTGPAAGIAAVLVVVT